MTKLLKRLSAWRGLVAPRQRPAAAQPYQGPATRWLLLEKGRNPSSDFYVRPLLAADGLPLVVRDALADAPQADDLLPGTRVAVVRYLSHAWAEALRAARGQLGAVVYFMDDDLLDASAWTTLPNDYRSRLKRDCAAVHRHIESLASEYWVSTEALRAKYDRLAPRLVPAREMTAAHTPALTFFYHGTASHRDEQQWLRPIVEQALHEHSQLHFELVGDHAVNRLYRDLPRVSIVHPMSWPNYRAFCESRHRHIGLAPLLPAPFNAARSHLKFFDIARCGAFGLYSDVEPYRSFVADGGDGLLLPNDPARWVRAIGELAIDPARRLALAAGAMARLEQARLPG
jgi:Glycosyl transferases group 1